MKLTRADWYLIFGCLVGFTLFYHVAGEQRLMAAAVSSAVTVGTFMTMCTTGSRQIKYVTVAIWIAAVIGAIIYITSGF